MNLTHRAHRELSPVNKSPIRLMPVAMLAGALLASGCSSCQQPPLPGGPLGTGGRPSQPPQAAPAKPPTEGPLCAVVASASEEAGIAPLTVEFSAEGMCTDAQGTFSWDFGDGSAASNQENPTHTYASAGTYTARVTLADPEHNTTDADEIAITVTAQ